MSRVIEIKVMTAATIKNKIGITLLRLSSVVIKLWLAWHTARELDLQISALAGQESIWDSQGFKEYFPFEVAETEDGWDHSLEQAQKIKVDHLDDVLDYLNDATDFAILYLKSLNPECLDDIVFLTPYISYIIVIAMLFGWAGNIVSLRENNYLKVFSSLTGSKFYIFAVNLLVNFLLTSVQINILLFIFELITKSVDLELFVFFNILTFLGVTALTLWMLLTNTVLMLCVGSCQMDLHRVKMCVSLTKKWTLLGISLT